MRAVVVAWLITAGAAEAATPVVTPARPPPAKVAAPRAVAPHATTECSACHTQTRWSDVTFNHEGTGFRLAGAHAQASCRACHRVDFRTRVPGTCGSCHSDRHAGELGLHCESCHGETDWHDTLFGAEGHARTAFPLFGKHAAIPCQECHGNMRARVFLQAPLACVACHRADYDGAAARSVDHVAAGFSTDCQSCHSTWAFTPARFDAHEACFRIASGPHAAVRCQQCHTNVAGSTVTGTCRSQPVTCASCHAHACARSDPQHANVMGYACVSQKCAECHQQPAP